VQASQDLGVHPTQLRSWVKALAADPEQAFPHQGRMNPEQAEIARLKREVLKAERDILKKPRPSSRWNRREVYVYCEHRGIWAVDWMCGALGVSRGVYACLRRPRSRRSRSNEELAAGLERASLAAIEPAESAGLARSPRGRHSMRLHRTAKTKHRVAAHCPYRSAIRPAAFSD
jgi:hypothetical protein